MNGFKELNDQIERFLKTNSLEDMNEELEKMTFNEMSTAWYNKNADKACWVENPTGYNNKYFKYLDKASYQKSTKVARISMLKPEYLNHRNTDGKQNWILTNKEKRELIELMQMPNKKYKNCTNWQAVLITYNEDNFNIDFDDTINDTFDKHEYPEAFNINFPMPDYSKL